MTGKPHWPQFKSFGTMVERVLDLSRLSTRLEFEAFEALPCGCVAGAYRAMPWALNLVRLEAKGPHCPRIEHELNNVLDVVEEADDDESDL